MRCVPFALLCLPLDAAVADEEAAEQQSKRCINSRTIRRTDVVNDDIVIFHVQGGRIYLNVLARTCKGLSREGRFSYVTHTRSICAYDQINVLKESGTGIYEGRACKLGRFRPMTSEELADFYRELREPPPSKRLEPPPIEDVVGEKPETEEL